MRDLSGLHHTIDGVAFFLTNDRFCCGDEFSQDTPLFDKQFAWNQSSTLLLRLVEPRNFADFKRIPLAPTSQTSAPEPGQLCQDIDMESTQATGASTSAAHDWGTLLDHTWVVIPLYNESSLIAEVVADLRRVFSNVVCIDDGSTDTSASRAREAGAHVVTHPFNLGQGAALQTGFEYALHHDCRFVVTFDADGQHRVEDASSMLARADRDDLAIVFGSRFLDNRTQPGFLRKIVLKTAVAITNVTTRTRLTDAHNGLRVIRSDALAQVHLQQNRMAHGTEIVIQLVRTKLPYAEEPIEVLYTEYSRSKGQSLLNSVNILIDLFIR
ncbi:MAG: glycosyltransferase family 2 protein [Microbacteriaceae bacterium]